VVRLSTGACSLCLTYAHEKAQKAGEEELSGAWRGWNEVFQKLKIFGEKIG